MKCLLDESYFQYHTKPDDSLASFLPISIALGNVT